MREVEILLTYESEAGYGPGNFQGRSTKEYWYAHVGQ